LLLLQYNQNGSFSLAYYAMLVAIFMILGAIDWAFNFILFCFVLCAVSELTFLGDDKRIGVGERELAVSLSVCNEFSV
jgi:cellulose synthase/poly-beta-1,6-N-acetylglucosamine synthase-like glycosyltransferase